MSGPLCAWRQCYAGSANRSSEPGRLQNTRPVNGLAFAHGMIATDRIDEAIRRLPRALQGRGLPCP